MNEFSVIEKYFRALTEGRSEALALKDDAAILKIPAGQELIVTSDTLNAGTHFLKTETPDFIARKALRVNLSDLAAMGAKPYAYQLCISFPKKPTEVWLKKFTSALRADNKKFRIFCSGGDTTVTKGPLSLTITAFGLVTKGKAVKRSGARPGDALVLTGPVGDAYAGLQMLRGKLPKNKSSIAAYRAPMPRLAAAETIRKYAHAAIDISDGLVADVAHIAKTSKCAARIDLPQIKFSTSVQKLIDQNRLTPEAAITGGDDYELALAVPLKNFARLRAELSRKGMRPQIVGFFDNGAGVSVYGYGGNEITISKSGWTHF